MADKFFDILGKRTVDTEEIVNLFKRVDIVGVVNDENFDDYYIKDNETADSISQRTYGNKDYYWIIFLTNNIIDPLYDWPMSEEMLSSYANIVNSMGTYDDHTLIQDLRTWNDGKRKIKVLKPELLNKFINVINNLSK